MAKDLTAAWAALSEQAAGSSTREPKALPEANPVTAIPARTGSGRPKVPTGGGIASPLVETAYADRLHWPDVNLTSTDGMITFVLQGGVKEVTFTDANGATVVQQYKQPTP